MRKHPISERFWDSEENFEPQEPSKINYLAAPVTCGNTHISVKKVIQSCKKIHSDRPLGGGGANKPLGLWGRP